MKIFSCGDEPFGGGDGLSLSVDETAGFTAFTVEADAAATAGADPTGLTTEALIMAQMTRG